MLTIDLNTMLLRVTPTAYGLRHPPGEEEATYGPREFWKDFIDRGVRVKYPRFSPSGEDFRIAASLLRKYPLDKLQGTYCRLFWTHYAEPLRERPEHPMRLYAAAIPQIRAELGEEAHGR